MDITKATYKGDLPGDRVASTRASWYKDVHEPSLNPNYNQGGAFNPAVGGGSEQVMTIGAGDTSFNVDLGGMWIGNRRFADAPFRINMLGQGFGRFFTAGGDVLFDENGIGSLANFAYEKKAETIDQTITGTTWQDLTGLTHTINGLERERIALFFANVSGYHDDTSGRLEFQFTLNSVSVGGIFCLNRVAAAGAIQTASNVIAINLPVGDNDVVLQARSSNANSGYIKGATIESTLSYLLLGR